MKRNLIILSIILVVSICFIFVLVGRSGSEMLIINASRQYNRIIASPEDTIRFPGLLSAIKVQGDNLLGYVNKQQALYQYNTGSRRIDTLLHKRTLFSGILSGVDMDPVTGTFYFISANANTAYSFHLSDARKDSLLIPRDHMAGGEKAFTGDGFFIRSIEDKTSLTCLKMVDLNRHTDTTLYTFQHFPDAGISADGFFAKDAASKKLFYIPYYNAEIIQYDETGNKISKIITIDQSMPRNYVVPTSEGYTVSAKAKMINTAAAADSTHLFVLSYASTATEKEAPGTVIDVYSTITGQYESSLRLPYLEGSGVELLERSGDKLFVAYNNTILRYKLHYQ